MAYKLKPVRLVKAEAVMRCNSSLYKALGFSIIHHEERNRQYASYISQQSLAILIRPELAILARPVMVNLTRR